MAIYANTNLVVDASKQWHLAQFANRAALPSGADGYMAYIQDQGDYVIKQGGAWHKFIRKPMDYKNETLIEQGTVANGYVNSSIYNTIHRIIHAQDILHLTTATTPFTSKYGGWHSTELYAYYHQGNNEGTTTQGTCKQSWSTYSVTTLATRSGVSGNVLNSLQQAQRFKIRLVFSTKVLLVVILPLPQILGRPADMVFLLPPITDGVHSVPIMGIAGVMGIRAHTSSTGALQHGVLRPIRRQQEQLLTLVRC